ncbi:BTB and MATH domain-containing protein 42 [Microplitis demolitor]|uniref:BTB and MATH domain-containing protein 42 n=1 Tax=Microplitis demolitor TaxID=69319 RepID=UPI0004CD66A6|nr:BTB and MATH domain-containing protein 42 [Microplitis demolitor]XP_008553471.1 BTB and MATH domain-containing protein 42 [Microplitis demolitor]XP_053596494.1 BTB and MATH domain-containing protein 42 [Microplitis demolitor]
MNSGENYEYDEIQHKWELSSIPEGPIGCCINSDYFKFPNNEVEFRMGFVRHSEGINHDVFCAKFEKTGALKGKLYVAFIFDECKIITMIDWEEFKGSVVSQVLNFLPASITCVVRLEKLFEKNEQELTLFMPGLDNNLFSSELCDIIVKVGSEELLAHKFVLAYHSPVFAVMFHADTIERRTNRINIQGFDVDTVKEALRFMYSGAVEPIDDGDLLLKLLSFAHMFQVDKLKNFCEFELTECLSVDNIIKILVGVDNYDVFYLKNSALEFISKNKANIPFAEAIEQVHNSQVLWDFFNRQAGMKN